MLKKPSTYSKKLVVAGNFAELVIYKKPVLYDFDRDVATLEKDPGAGRSSYSNARASAHMRRLVNNNFTTDDLFVTLTFPGEQDYTQVPVANYYFKKFIQRLKYYLPHPFKYIAILEWQSDYYHVNNIKKALGGNIHYHMIISYPERIPHSELWRIWANKPVGYDMTESDGYYCWITRTKSTKNLGAYFAKHSKKYDLDEIQKLKGQKKYFRSRGLLEPVEFLDPDDIDGYLRSHCAEETFEAERQLERGQSIKYVTFKIHR